MIQIDDYELLDLTYLKFYSIKRISKLYDGKFIKMTELTSYNWMSQYNKKIQFITKMDSSLPFNIKKLSNLIKDLHNHEKFDFPQ